MFPHNHAPAPAGLFRTFSTATLLPGPCAFKHPSLSEGHILTLKPEASGMEQGGVVPPVALFLEHLQGDLGRWWFFS